MELQEELVDKEIDIVEEEMLIMERITKERIVTMMRWTSSWMKRGPTPYHLESNT